MKAEVAEISHDGSEAQKKFFAAFDVLKSTVVLLR
jgi:hypothetical protein